MEEIITRLKEQIVEALNLEDVRPEDIGDDEPLFGETGLGLDSIDALELILILERDYGIKLSNPSEGRYVFTDVKTMAEYILSHRK